MLESLLAPAGRAVLDALGAAVVLLGPEGQLLHATPPAVRLLGERLTGPRFDGTQFLAAVRATAVDVTVIRLAGAHSAEVLHPAEEAGAETLAVRERRAILERLEATGWRLAETARQLGISRTTLWRRLRAYGLTGKDGAP